MRTAYARIAGLESQLHPRGLSRAPLWQFILWIGFFGAILLWGVYAMLLCWIKGLNQTNMNDYYGFALWIWADLGIIAIGGGAFFTGLLRYVFGIESLKYILNYAVLVGFICYSSALVILGIDVGQPLRFWFIFWHANVHSMLTEVAFCLSCYFGVLCIEYIPLVLENRKLDEIPFFHHTAHNFHEVMAIFAATGAFLSFFHQGSLGGVAGVMFGRPFAYRPEFYIWPTTFFLFTWSAAACGPCFTILATKITEAVTRKKAGDGQRGGAPGQDRRLDALDLLHRQNRRHLVLGLRNAPPARPADYGFFHQPVPDLHQAGRGSLDPAG